MTKDVEETVAELGDGYREVVDRMVAAYRPAGGAMPTETARSAYGRIALWGLGYLAAASLLVLAGFGIAFRGPTAHAASRAKMIYVLAYSADESAISEIIGSQNSDGSWANDFLTQQNAAAIRGIRGAEVAYRRALRYLKSKGLRPLSDEELRRRGDLAANALARS